MFLEILLGKRFPETLKTVPEIRARKTYSWEPCLEPLGNLSWELLPENLPLRNLFLGILLGNLLLGTRLGICSWEPLPENLPIGNLFLGTLLGSLLLGTLLGSLLLGTLLGNLLLGTLAWEPVPGNLLGTCSWEPCLETNLAWEPLPGTRFPTLRRVDLAAPRDSLGKGNPSWEPSSQPCAPCGFGCPDLLRNLYYG